MGVCVVNAIVNEKETILEENNDNTNYNKNNIKVNTLQKVNNSPVYGGFSSECTDCSIRKGTNIIKSLPPILAKLQLRKTKIIIKE